MEPAVAERRAWPIEAVIDEYETYSEQAANVFASVQDPPLSETMLPMGELGTHPMSILPSTFLFDGYTHLRNDILAPTGSIDRPQPPRDEKRLAPDDRVDARGPAVDVCRPPRASSTGPSCWPSTDRAAARGRSRPAATTAGSPDRRRRDASTDAAVDVTAPITTS